MILRVEQTSRELFGAGFQILTEKNEPVGSILFQGSIASMEGSFQIRCGPSVFSMIPTRRKEARTLAGEYIKRAPDRPYAVQWEGGRGVIFHDQIHLGFMREAGYHFLLLNDQPYYLYYLGFGEKGICAPIYRGEEYVAEITKPCLVRNDLHTFTLSIGDVRDLAAVLYYCCYIYVIACYRAGQKMVSGDRKHIYVTKEQYLLDKCRNRRFLDE